MSKKIWIALFLVMAVVAGFEFAQVIKQREVMADNKYSRPYDPNEGRTCPAGQQIVCTNTTYCAKWPATVLNWPDQMVGFCLAGGDTRIYKFKDCSCVTPSPSPSPAL